MEVKRKKLKTMTSLEPGTAVRRRAWPRCARGAASARAPPVCVKFSEPAQISPALTRFDPSKDRRGLGGRNREGTQY